MNNETKVVQHSITGELLIPVTEEMREIIPIRLGTKLVAERTIMDIKTQKGFREIYGLILYEVPND